MQSERYRPWHTLLAIAAMTALGAHNAVMELWPGLQVGMIQWTQANRIAALVQWALPVMVMLAGSIFLAPVRPCSLRTLWRHMIPAATVSCVLWWCAAAVVCLQKNYPQELDLSTYMHCLSQVLDAPYNISYCQMLVSMFLLYPLLWRIVESDSTTRYCLAVLFVINLMFPLIRQSTYTANVTLFTDQLNWGFFSAWAFYLLLGAYLTRHSPAYGIRLAVYCLGIISTGLIPALTSWRTESTIGFCADYQGMLSPLTACQAAAIFLAAASLGRRGHFRRLPRVKGLWMSVPIVGIAGCLSARFLPAYTGNASAYALSHMIADAALALLLTLAPGAVPGFRLLVGSYQREGMEQ